MNNEKNYKLYKKHKHEIFEMIYETWEQAPISGLQPDEEYEKELNEFCNLKREEINKRITEMGFELNDDGNSDKNNTVEYTK